MTEVQTAARTDEPFRETMTPLLRPGQVNEAKEDKKNIDNVLSTPFLRNQVEDVGALVTQLRKIDRQLETFTPREYGPSEIDAAVTRERELREQFVQGMPTGAEMRRNAAGAVDKHMAWEARNKSAIMEWKNIRLRLLASGALGDVTHAADVANVELFRPTSSSQELDLSTAQIVRPTHHIPRDAVSAVVISDEEIAKIKELAPEVADKLALMTADLRAQVKDLVGQIMQAGGDEQEAADPMAKARAVKARKAAERAAAAEKAETED